MWTGSTNWTLDSWTREENVLITVVSEALAAAYARDFEDLWGRGRVEGSGSFDTSRIDVGGIAVRAWFSPGRGPELSHRIAECIGVARRRVRIASPVLTAAPILAALNQALGEGVVDVAGVSDATQVAQVFGQWRGNENSAWKGPLLARVLSGLPWSGKVSTPYAPGAVHDYMHAKVTVADDIVFVGSFNLSRSGEENAENVLEIADAGAGRADGGVRRRRARALPGDRRPRLRRELNPLALRARAHAGDDFVGVVGDREEVEVGRRDHPVGHQPLAHPIGHGRPRTTAGRGPPGSGGSCWSG